MKKIPFLAMLIALRNQDKAAHDLYLLIKENEGFLADASNRLAYSKTIALAASAHANLLAEGAGDSYFGHTYLVALAQEFLREKGKDLLPEHHKAIEANPALVHGYAMESSDTWNDAWAEVAAMLKMPLEEQETPLDLATLPDVEKASYPPIQENDIFKDLGLGRLFDPIMKANERFVSASSEAELRRELGNKVKAYAGMLLLPNSLAMEGDEEKAIETACHAANRYWDAYLAKCYMPPVMQGE
jgi:hypothetical protein